MLQLSKQNIRKTINSLIEIHRIISLLCIYLRGSYYYFYLWYFLSNERNKRKMRLSNFFWQVLFISVVIALMSTFRINKNRSLVSAFIYINIFDIFAVNYYLNIICTWKPRLTGFSKYSFKYFERKNNNNTLSI